MSDYDLRRAHSRGSSGETPALFLIGHGTRDRDGIEEFRAFVALVGDAMVKADLPEVPVGHGFLEFAEPGASTALDTVAECGSTSVVAVPVVLLAAGHLKNDGPSLLAEARRRHPKVAFSYARDLGVHPVTLEIAAEAVAGTLARSGVDTPLPRAPQVSVGPDGAAAVLVGRGSTDPDANAELYKVARLLSDSRGLPLVEPAFVSLSPPSVGDALDRLQRLGARQIGVVPYFLFSGVLSRRIDEQAAAWAAAHPATTVTTAGAMGPDRRLADLIVERYREASTGTAFMNCDCCAYRTSLPGYEARVGSPPAGPAG